MYDKLLNVLYVTIKIFLCLIDEITIEMHMHYILCYYATTRLTRGYICFLVITEHISKIKKWVGPKVIS